MRHGEMLAPGHRARPRRRGRHGRGPHRDRRRGRAGPVHRTARGAGDRADAGVRRARSRSTASARSTSWPPRRWTPGWTSSWWRRTRVARRSTWRRTPVAGGCPAPRWSSRRTRRPTCLSSGGERVLYPDAFPQRAGPGAPLGGRAVRRRAGSRRVRDRSTPSRSTCAARRRRAREAEAGQLSDGRQSLMFGPPRPIGRAERQGRSGHRGATSLAFTSSGSLTPLRSAAAGRTSRCARRTRIAGRFIMLLQQARAGGEDEEVGHRSGREHGQRRPATRRPATSQMPHHTQASPK